MFKKLNEKIDFINNKISGLWRKVDRRYEDIYHDIQSMRIAIQHIPTIESQQRIIESQQRTIEQLANALQDKYEHGLFIFSEDCKIPMVIRNGKEITNEMTSYFSIDWTVGEMPDITIEQRAGTFHDSEV